MRKNSRVRLPRLEDSARRLLHGGLCAVCIYLLFTAVYAKMICGELYAEGILIEMLRSAYISLVILSGGVLVLDCDIKFANRK